jgi:hypothetical protein
MNHQITLIHIGKCGGSTVYCLFKKNNTNLGNKLLKLEYKNLKKYLHKDYECINKLYELGCLSKKTI